MRVRVAVVSGLGLAVVLVGTAGQAVAAPPAQGPATAVFPSRLQAGRFAGESTPSLSIAVSGLASADADDVRSVSIDGTPVETYSSDDTAAGTSEVSFSAPRALTVGDHEVTFTQTGATPYTATRTVPVLPPAVAVTGRAAPSNPSGVQVSVTDTGFLDTQDVTVVGAAGDRHTATIGGASSDGETFTRAVDVTGLSVGTATLTMVSDFNGASAGTTFVVDGASITGPGGLAPDQRIVTVYGYRELVMQSDGNLVYDDSRAYVFWNSHTAGHPGARLAVQSDGNVVVYDVNGKALWNAGTAGIGKGARLGFDPNGDVGIYTASGRRAFAAYAYPPPETNVLMANHYLYTGQFLTSRTTLSSDPNVFFTVQHDGNIVVSTIRGPRWSARTEGHPGTYIVLQADGNLVIHAANGAVLWANHAHASGTRLVAQGDGNIVEYAPNGTALWSTRTALF